MNARDLATALPLPSAEEARSGGSTPRAAAEQIGMRVGRAAELLDVSDQWLRKNAQRLRIPHAKIGGVLLFEPGLLREWLRAQCVATAGERTETAA